MFASPTIAQLSVPFALPWGGSFLRMLLRLEAWLDARNSARSLYALDDCALSDLGLSRSDVERVNAGIRQPVGTA